MTTEEKIQEPTLTPVQKLGEAIADRVERWMPNPFLFAILLTYVAAIAAVLSEGSSVTEITSSWYGGFWNLLQFAMQMVIILVTANVVAYHHRVRKFIHALVRLPKNGRQAVVLVGIGSMLTGWTRWVSVRATTGLPCTIRCWPLRATWA
jgi:short-chain fatty acids transporter